MNSDLKKACGDLSVALFVSSVPVLKSYHFFLVWTMPEDHAAGDGFKMGWECCFLGEDAAEHWDGWIMPQTETFETAVAATVRVFLHYSSNKGLIIILISNS